MRHHLPTRAPRAHRRWACLLAAVLGALLLAGCGGGGGSGEGTQAPSSNNWGEMQWGTGNWSN